MTRLIIADPQALMRQGVLNVLSREPGLDVVGEGEDAQGLVEAAADVDLVVMDPGAPAAVGVSALQRLRALRPGLPVLILSTLSEEEVALDFIRAGAAGFISKDSSPDELLAAVRKVSAGGHYVSNRVAEGMILGLTTRQPAREPLSARELQVLRLIAAGKPVKSIARDLSLSVSTVHTYRGRILHKLSMSSDIELARYAMRQHLVE